MEAAELLGEASHSWLRAGPLLEWRRRTSARIGYARWEVGVSFYKGTVIAREGRASIYQRGDITRACVISDTPHLRSHLGAGGMAVTPRCWLRSLARMTH